MLHWSSSHIFLPLKSFALLKFLEPQNIFVYWVVSTFSIVEIKTEKLRIYLSKIINLLHSNIKNIFIKNYIFPKIYSEKSSIIFIFLQIPLSSGLIEDSWVFIGVSHISVDITVITALTCVAPGKRSRAFMRKWKWESKIMS